jgi:hypothetical protein
MTCKCGSKRIIEVHSHCSDRCVVNYKDSDNNPWYVPHDLGIGGGDDVEFAFCADCGTLQNFKPLSDEEISQALER